MKTSQTLTLGLLGVCAIAAIAPVHAQTSAKKQAKQERKAVKREVKAERKVQAMETMNNGSMTGGTMPGNNTAAVQAGIDRANKTLSDMTALLNQMDARRRGGAQ